MSYSEYPVVNKALVMTSCEAGRYSNLFTETIEYNSIKSDSENEFFINSSLVSVEKETAVYLKEDLSLRMVYFFLYSFLYKY